MLAAEGFKAPSRPYEGDAGLYTVLLGPDAVVDVRLVTAGLGNHWEFAQLAIKPFPIVHHAHSVLAIDKFRGNAERLYQRDRVEALIEAVMALDGKGRPSDVTALLGEP